MHFAFPPKQSPFVPHSTRIPGKFTSNHRRKQIQLISYIVLGLLTVVLVLRWLGGSKLFHEDGSIPEDGKILILTVTDERTMSEDYLRLMKANREEYASRHGYTTHYVDTSAYTHLIGSSPSSWALVPALRHALSLHPDVDYVWSLTPNALIMNTTLSLQAHILSRLPSLMLKDIPVVPPDSVIHTFSHLKANQAYCIITQDISNLAHTSFLLRNTEKVSTATGVPKDSWSHFFLDAWFDPLYRTYSFQKAENHALEHLVQWHPTVLAKMVIIEQRLLNSYNTQAPTIIDPDRPTPRTHDSMWQNGDLVVNFKGCKDLKQRDCEHEMRTYFQQWQNQMEESEGRKITVQLLVDDYKPASQDIQQQQQQQQPRQQQPQQQQPQQQQPQQQQPQQQPQARPRQQPPPPPPPPQAQP